ncbi:MAG: HDOD domain-containing protein, partial [Gammaproteobacteria bacterium]
KVLVAANSPYYRYEGEIKDLHRMIIVLGLSAVRTIAITQTVQQFFTKISHSHHAYLELIWYRSLTCAHLSIKLAKLTAYRLPEEAYLAGLLHRLGQLVLLECFPKDYPDCLAEHLDARDGAVERNMFGAAHNEIGGCLIDSWKLQSFISDAVLHQFQPYDAIADSSHLVKIVNLAGLISGSDSVNKEDVHDQAYKLFGLGQSLVDEMIEEVSQEVGRTAQSLGLSIATPDGNALRSLTTPDQRHAVYSRLGQCVKTFALASALQQHLESSSEISPLADLIRRDASLLFGFQRSALFIFDPDANNLVGIGSDASQGDALWSSVAIALESGHSLLAKALLKKEILHSFDGGRSHLDVIVDRQICRRLGSEGLLVIPLYQNVQPVGVLVAGVDQADIAAIIRKREFIQLFAKEAAQAVVNLKQPVQSHRQELQTLQENYRLHAKKLVHEANNPLSIIKNYLYLLSEKVGEDSVNEVRIIQDEIDRVGKILLHLPDVTEQLPQEDGGWVNVNALIIELSTIFQAGIVKTGRINIDLNLDAALPAILTRKNKLKQILINLLKNAAEVLPPGGNIALSTKDWVYLGKKCYIEVKIADDGPGMPKEIMEHLYAPVKSTKGKDHSGFGLAISKSLLDEMNGIIRCESSPGQGTIFQIFLPRLTSQRENG